MTKLKNTKKGMAKKALSVSLVAAMLATSNVPVWAAEDLFSDGSAAVEAPVVEEPAAEVDVFSAEPAEAEAPAEEVNSDISLQAEESNYNVEFKDLPSEIEWGNSAIVKVKVTDTMDNNKNVTGEKEYTLVVDGNVPSGMGSVKLTAGADGYATISLDSIASADNVGKNIQIRIQDEENNGWYKDSASILIAKQTVSGALDLTKNVSYDQAVKYTGKTITTVPSNATVDSANAKYTYKGVEYLYNQMTPSADITPDLKLSDFIIEGKDLVNAYNVSNEKVTATADIQSKYYDGKFTVTYTIWRKTIDSENFAENIKVELPKTVYQYTGKELTVKEEDVIVTDLNSGKTVENALAYDSFTMPGTVGSQKVALKLDASVGSLKNYSFSDNTTPDIKYTVTKRDLSDTANTIIEIPAVSVDSLTNSKINAGALNGDLIIKDADGTDISDGIRSEVTIDLGVEGDLSVTAGQSYTVTVKAANGENVTGSRQVTFKVVARDLADTVLVKGSTDVEEAETYTGEQITKGLTNLTKDNFEKIVGKLQFKNTDNTVLIPGVNYSTTLEFGENINAGKNAGKIIINGLGDFAGSQKVIYFDISQRRATDVEVPAKVLFNASNQEAEDYAIATAVVAKYKDDDGKEVELTVPESDYDVEYEFVNDDKGTAIPNGEEPNQAGNYIKTTVTKKTGVSGNFTFTELVNYTEITNQAITDADIQMNQTTYTYTGKEVELDYKVVVNGVELEKGVDYKETITNGTDVGEGILTITGMGAEYDDTTATAKFTIVAAKTSDVKVAVKESAKDDIVYDGEKQTPTESQLDITLNGVSVAKDFVITYPAGRNVNVNAGDGQLTLTPKKGNKNFDGAGDFTFTIGQAELDNVGTLKIYNDRNEELTGTQSFKYDGTAKTFAKTTYSYTPASPMKFTADDYEIRYVDNVYGNEEGDNGLTAKAHILVIAKGNYKGADTYKCADGTEIENVVQDYAFSIERLAFLAEDITVSNGSYKGGFDVDPDVTVTYKGQTLVKDRDYELIYPAGQNRKEVTNGKTLEVEIIGKGGYRRAEDVTFMWGIDKFNFADADIMVSGTDTDPEVKVMNGSILVDESEYDLTIADGKVTVTATEGNKNYEGSQTVDIETELERPETPQIARVEVNGNKAKVVLEGECDGATGYDFVISTNGQSSDANRLVNKNILGTETTFQYLQQGMYWAHCHAWKRVDGVKVFSEYSQAFPFSITSITPEQPVITSMKKSGRNLTVTWTQCTNATGYDIVMGTAMRKVNGENRPVEYGKAVKKITNGNTVTVTFRSIPKGTYYVGLHAYNRTSETGVKVFSPWSNAKKVTF